jgi:hypothetical protein
VRAFLSVLVDESHSQAWSIRPEVAAEVNPVKPADASYAQAAQTLRRRGHTVEAHVSGPITPDVLDDVDVLVLPHASEAAWDRVVPGGSPKFEGAEMDAVEAFVRRGGGLVVLAECDQDKYGNNLNELLGRFGVHVVTTTVMDPVERFRDVDTWVMGRPGPLPEADDLLAGVGAVSLYRAGVLDVDGAAAAAPAGSGPLVLLRTSPHASTPDAPLAVALPVDAGRVVVVADSDLVGDDSIDDNDQRRFWANLVTWAAGTPSSGATDTASSDVLADPAWTQLHDAVGELRTLQSKDGSIDLAAHDEAAARALVERIVPAISRLATHLPHDEAYLAQVVVDLQRWADEGFGVPDFLDSLLLFRPETQRVDGLEHLVVFPMYTQNGNPNRVLEAVLLRVVWPDWLAALERSPYDNAAFVPVTFLAFTGGYDTHSAVLFPETVAVREVPRFTWGAIFCDREAARFRAVCGKAAQTLRLALPPDAARLLGDQQLAQDTYVLWDLIHDRTHSHGDLPFDPFMIKQRMPYWMYALEELRCDLTTFREAVRLEAEGQPYGPMVQYAILFDRLFRFPITGERVRNYDGLGGQLLFAYLHRNDVIRWTDNRLKIDWTALPGAVVALCEQVETLYHDGIDRSKVAQWLAAYELVSTYVPPNPGSTWAKGASALPLDGEPKHLVDLVMPDEFPLNTFYEALRRKLGDTVAATRGITGTSDLPAA